jgi:mannose-1-phosphate guanylyltransferase
VNNTVTHPDSSSIHQASSDVLHAVIMAGGSGTRFWPLSRLTRPKQLLRLTGERTLIQSTFDRTQPDVPAAQVWVVTNAAQAEATARQLPEVPARNILVEPRGRNTAPCIGLAAIHLIRQDPDAVMLVMPADHVISPAEKFREALEQARGLVASDPERYVLFGIRPSYPAVGFGYIEASERLPQHPAAQRVASFREKPDRATAEHYLSSGNFYWNCGIFVWKAAAILSALEHFEPDIHRRLVKLAGHMETQGWQTALEKEFLEMKSISIDFAVLERADNICMLEAPFDWDDVGAWNALERIRAADVNQNIIEGRHAGLQTSGCIIHSSDEHLIATYGLENCIVVHTPDATLVARRDDENAVRRIVELLEEEGHAQFL